MSSSSTALFDSSRAALEFALNQSRTRYAAPIMNRVMNEMAAAAKPTKKPKKGRKKAQEEEQEEPELRQRLRASPRRPDLRGLDASAQAGMILLHLAKLPRHMQHALIAATARPSMPCSCKSPCCSGYRRNPEWGDAMEALIAGLDAMKPPKMRKDHPRLLQAIIERRYDPAHRWRLHEIAELAHVSEMTVTTRQKEVLAWLEEAEKDGWGMLDHYLIDAGIVGAVL